MAPSLQHGGTGMSRSFVRAWATVATIMAMVSFAFIQPMPETGRPLRGEASGFTELLASDPGNLSEAPPFVDTVLTGKTFTPYVTVDAAPRLFQGAPRVFRTAEALLASPRPPPEPLIRPG